MKNKLQAIEAYQLLNNFVGDLIAGTRTLELYQLTKIKKIANETTQLFVKRMCISHLIITISKWNEFYDKYKSIIPKDVIDKAKNLKKDINKRKLINFRNTVAGHIWDKKLNRPLTPNEIDNRLQQVFITNQKDFINWINDHKNNKNVSIVSVCELLRKKIQEEYNLTEEQIFT